ncbi:MAG: dockerin type I domain-containing protein [Candidatus Marinimicrobia bacterium]|nr:dockerin type I domain-containing protein [Candidatus Neomarinimicrobiota bacterium]
MHLKIIIRIIIALITVAGLGQDYNTTLLNRWADGRCLVTVTEGDTVYVGQGAIFQIVDFSDLDNPTIIGSITLPSLVLDIAIVDDHAFIANSFGGLRVINIGDPEHPTEITVYQEGISIGTVDIYDHYAFLGYYGGGLEIVDISDPQSLAQIYFSDTFGTHGIIFQDHFAYSVGSFIRVLDLSDINNPIDRGSYDVPTLTYGFDVSGDYGYIAIYGYGLQVIDVSNPDSLIAVADVQNSHRGWHVDVAGDYAYIAEKDDGFSIVNIADPLNPTLSSSIYPGGTAWSLTVQDSLMYLSNGGNGVCIYDVTDSTAPVAVGNLDTGAKSKDVAIRGEHVLVANGLDGLTILAPSDSTEMAVVSSSDYGGNAFGIDVFDNYVYLADRDSGLVIFEISDLSSPVEVNRYSIDGTLNDVTIHQNYAYLADITAGLKIVDVNDPLNPSEVSFAITGESVYSVDVQNGYAYAACYNGLKILDVSDPGSPILCGSFSYNRFYDVDVVGNHAYLAAYSSGLIIVDITDPENPFVTGSYDNPDYLSKAYGVSVSHQYAYIADYLNGLGIIDIVDPYNPVEAGEFNTGGVGVQVYAQDNLAYLADLTDGVYVIRNDVASEFLRVDSAQALQGDTISVAVHSGLYTTSAFTTLSLNITGFQNSLEYLELEISSTMMGTDDWQVSTVTTDSALIVNASGLTPLSDEGILFRIQFAIPDTLTPQSVMLAIEELRLDDVELDLDVRNGWVNVASSLVYGDVSQDGEISTADATLILSHLAGSITLTPAQQLNADVNLDSLVSAWDASIISQYVANLFDTLPVDDSDQAYMASGEVSIDDVGVEAGVFVDIPIKLINGANLFSFEGALHYNSEILSLTGDSLIWPAAFSDFSIEIGSENGLIKFAGASTGSVETDSIFAVAHFYVNENFETNSTTQLILEDFKLNGNVEVPILTATLTSVVEVVERINIPTQFILEQNFPNPFNPTTTISYGLPEASDVSIIIYDVMGHEIIELVKCNQVAGWYDIQWNGVNDGGNPISTGLYFARIQAGQFSDVIKVVTLR